MADIHVDAAGSNTSTYDTWAKAATTIATAGGAEAAGDRILMGSAYSESVATVSIALAGSATSPVQLLSGTKDTTSGITALIAGATITTTSTTHLWSGNFYAYGVNFVGSSSSSHNIHFGWNSADVVMLDTCNIRHTGAGSSSEMNFGCATDDNGSVVTLKNCGLRLGAATQRIYYYSDVRIFGGAWESGGTAPSAIFQSGAGRGHKLTVEGFDFTNAGTAVNLHGNGQGGASAIFRDITLAASWTGAPIADASLVEGIRVEVWNYKVGSTWNRFWIKDRRCSLTAETTLVRTGGSSDADGNYSVKMVTTANCAWPSSVARSMDFVVDNSTTGSSITVTMEILRDSATNLTDREVWLEVEEPDGTITNDACATVITSAADQTTSSETWTTTGMANPNKQKLAVTINASKAGPLLCRVMCAKPSTTFYICGKPAVA